MRYRALIIGLALALFAAAAVAAVDTENKRGSVLNMTGYVTPTPSGAINAGDRAQLAGSYRGFFEPPTPVAVTLQKNLLSFGLGLN